MVDVWPALPLVIKDKISKSVMDNVVTLLGHHNRVCQIDLKVTRLLFQEVLAAMEVSSPELTDLWFSSRRVPVISNLHSLFLPDKADIQ